MEDIIKEIIIEVLQGAASEFGYTLAIIISQWILSFLMLIVLVIISLICYILYAKAVSKIAEDRGLTNHKIFAWIPILRTVLLFEIIDSSIAWWVHLLVVLGVSLFFPVAPLIMIIALWTKIAHIYLQEWWKALIVGILSGLPVLNIIPAIYFAYYYENPAHISPNAETIITVKHESTGNSTNILVEPDPVTETNEY